MKAKNPNQMKSLVAVTTGNEIAGQEIVRYLGIVRGITLRTTGLEHVMPKKLGSFKFFGNVPEIMNICEESRKMACEKMLMHARQIGADAVIAFRYDTTTINKSYNEILAYGTAVKIKKEST